MSAPSIDLGITGVRPEPDGIAGGERAIGQLSSIGLELHGIRSQVPDDDRSRLDASIGELDVAIAELRSIAFDRACGR